MSLEDRMNFASSGRAGSRERLEQDRRAALERGEDY